MSVEAGRLDAFLAATPYAKFLGLEAGWGADGLTVALPYRYALVGNTNLPALHGGVLGALLEMTALMALTCELPSARASTVDFTIEYLRSAGPRETHAAAAVKRLGRRFANVEAFAWQDDRMKPVAAISGRFAVG